MDLESREQNEGIFDIRGHHLCNLWESFLYAQDEPQISPQQIAETTARESLDHCLRKDRYYAADIQGPDDADVLTRREQVLAGWIKFYRDFLTLPDDQKVRISAARDGICRSIIVGNHCNTSPEEDDNQQILRFLRAYDQISSEMAYPAILERISRFNNEQHGLVIVSNLAIVRNVFLHMMRTSQRFS